ncbi:MAG: pyridoxamine 5'-phosphate oxidase family protein [Actinomycetales bacterium]
MSITIKSGPWDLARIRTYLDSAIIPIRLASAGSPGPTVQSLWFLPQDDILWCCTQRDALVVRRLQADPNCGFEIAADHPPYRGVRGHGRADIKPDHAGEVLPRLLARYSIPAQSSLASWLLSRLDDEVAIAITDLSVTSWDYAERMSGALSEDLHQ